jgi:hypothetical protein
VYTFHGAVVSMSGAELDRLADGASLEVRGDGKCLGHLSISPEFRIDGSGTSSE